MPTAFPLLALSTGALLAAALMPRMGAPVLLAFPQAQAALAAFQAPGWRVQRMQEHGGLTFVTAMPDDSSAQPFALLRTTGAWFALHAAPGSDCGPAR